MAIGPIPWNFIMDYARMKRLDSDMTDAFLTVIRVLDEAYLKNIRDHSKRETELTRPPKVKKRG